MSRLALRSVYDRLPSNNLASYRQIILRLTACSAPELAAFLHPGSELFPQRTGSENAIKKIAVLGFKSVIAPFWFLRLGI